MIRFFNYFFVNVYYVNVHIGLQAGWLVYVGGMQIIASITGPFPLVAPSSGTKFVLRTY